MRTIEEQKTHYDKLLDNIKRILERYEEYEDHPETQVLFGVIAKEELGSDKERTAYTQLIHDIVQLYHEAKN